jgi:hypothetical protein
MQVGLFGGFVHRSVSYASDYLSLLYLLIDDDRIIRSQIPVKFFRPVFKIYDYGYAIELIIYLHRRPLRRQALTECPCQPRNRCPMRAPLFKRFLNKQVCPLHIQVEVGPLTGIHGSFAV